MMYVWLFNRVTYQRRKKKSGVALLTYAHTHFYTQIDTQVLTCYVVKQWNKNAFDLVIKDKMSQEILINKN